MSKQLLIYDTVVPVNRETHNKTSVKPAEGFDFARSVNTVPLVDAEIPRAAAEIPVVFTKVEGTVVPLALLGTEQDQNSFVDEAGNWTGQYVPAFFRRYPFVFATQDGSDQMTLCLDSAYPGLNEDDLGERMFDAEGNHTSYLRSVLKFTQDYQGAHVRTQEFCNRLDETDVLEEARIDFTRADGTTGGVTGFLRVNEEKLRALPDETVLSLFRAGDLAMIHAHLMSLSHVDRVVAQSVQQLEPVGAIQ